MTFMKTGIRASLLVAVTLALASTAQADRRTGLYGNLLITDQDDLFFFPQEVLTYRNRISLDYGGGTGSGNGLFLMGDEGSAFGIAIHRGDNTVPGAAYFDDSASQGLPALALANPASPIAPGGAFPTTSPATMIDLMYAMDSGLGFRLAFGPANNKGVAADGTESGDGEFYVLGTVGYGTGTRGEDGRYDFSGSILFDGASSVAGGDDVASGAYFGLSGMFRGFMPMDDTMDLGLLGALALTNTGVSNDAADPTFVNSTTVFGLTGGVGPSFRFGEASVSAYGTVALSFAASEPNDQVSDDESATINLVIPGVNVAVEVPVNDWFFLRTGADYRWVSTTVAQADESGTSAATSTFGWNAGAGVKSGGFSFDGALSHGFVTGGPNFISGAAGNLFLMANLTYDFDDARSGAAPAAEPAEEPAEDEEAADEQPAATDTAPATPAPAEVAPVPADPNAPAQPAPAAAPAPAEPQPAPIAPLPLPAAPPGQ